MVSYTDIRLFSGRKIKYCNPVKILALIIQGLEIKYVCAFKVGF